MIRVGEEDVVQPEGGIHKRDFNPILTCSITINENLTLILKVILQTLP